MQAQQLLAVELAIDCVVRDLLFLCCVEVLGLIEEQVLDGLVYFEVELGDGVFEGLLYASDVLLEQLGEDGEVSLPEADFADAWVLLP